MTEFPIISVITPTLNSRKFIEECIESALAQCQSRVEHLFIDGGSSDGTIEILSSYQTRYPGRVQWALLKGSSPVDAWNHGLKIAQGDILGWIGSDDIYEPGALQAVIDYFQDHPEVLFLHGHCHYVRENGRDILWTHKAAVFPLDYLLNQNDPVALPSAFYRKEVVRKVGWVHKDGRDFDYMIRIAKQFQMHPMDRVLARFRVHPNSDSAGTNSKRRMEILRFTCHTSRKHGGRFFSAYRKRYYLFLFSLPLRLILGTYFPKFSGWVKRTPIYKTLAEV